MVHPPRQAETPAGPQADPETSRHFRVFGHEVPAPQLAAGLYLVATPIGNLGDVTIRALATLAGATTIACEDGRVTRRLTDRYGITTPLLTYHDHNAEAVRPRILALLDGGAAVALVSDAGTPLISDPGFKLVEAAQAHHHTVTAVPGASAVLAALTASGLPTDSFFFEGFLPPRETARLKRLDDLAAVPGSLVFFEGGSRIAAMLGDLALRFGDRPAAVCRELTKVHEEIARGTTAALAQQWRDGAETRGEFVVVVGPPAAGEGTGAADVDRLLAAALATQSLKDAVEAVTAATGEKRRVVYRRALQLAGARPSDGEAPADPATGGGDA